MKTMNDSRSQFDHLPPHSIVAEQCLLASMMLDRTFAAEAINGVGKDAFYLEDHGIIFGIIRECCLAGRRIDPVILREELAKRGQLDEIGGTAYLAECLNTVPSAANGQSYAEIVSEKARMRGIIATCNDALRAAYEASSEQRPSLDLLAKMQQGLAGVATGSVSETMTMADVAEREFQQLETGGGVACVQTGFRDVDHAFRGIGLGETLVVAARPSMGKSTWCRQVAVNAAFRGEHVGFVALEESDGKLFRNILSWYTGVQNGRLRLGRDGGKFSRSEWEAARQQKDRIAKLPIHITTTRPFARIAAIAHTWKMKHDIRLMVVDHMGLVEVGKQMSTYDRASIVSTELKQLYKRLNVAGITVCQINRSNTQREDKRPMMADLRDSGRIEEDADGILLLHREDYYHLTDPSYVLTREAELIPAKWRDGDTSTLIRLRSCLSTQHFEDLADELPEGL